MGRHGAGRRSVLVLIAAVAGALVLAACGGGRFARTSGALAHRPPTSASGPAFVVLQMNLCLSGLAGCYRGVAYPAVLREAAARIAGARPDAVTFNEACRRDVARIAGWTGYRVRFSTVRYRGRRLPCVRPGGRGVFGDAVLTRAGIQRTESGAFDAQAGLERRRWLCVTTRLGIDVCTAHLNTRAAEEVAGNDGQCTELSALLARRATERPVVFGGDVNRRAPCAPGGAWIRTDGSAAKAPGLQQVYGSAALRSPAPRVLPIAHSDHDALLVTARLAAGRSGARR